VTDTIDSVLDRAISRGAWAIFLLLSILHTWPIARSPAHLSLNHNADAQQAGWTLSWIAHTLPRDPWHLFDANIFAPETNTLAYSDSVIVPALVGAPVRWLGGSPVLTFNLSMLAGLTLTGWATWWAARRWTGSASAALVAGALAAFNPHVLTRLPHIVAAYAWTIPLSLYLADRLLDSRRRQHAWALALVVAATAATSLYWLALVGLNLAVVLGVAFVSRRWQAARTIALAGAGGLLLALPTLWPYARLASTGVSRPIETIPQFSATVAGYLASQSRLHAGWSAPFFERDVSVFFAGFTAIALAVVGLCAPFAAAHLARRRALLLLTAAIGVVLSLGPATPVYVWLYGWFPPLGALRAAARFGYLYLAAIAFCAAVGVAWLQSRATMPAHRMAIALAALTLVTAEAWSAPILTVPFSRIPAIYDHIKTAPGPVLLAEMPFYPGAMVSENAEYELNSTAHFRPLMNGASGYTPDSYRRRADYYWYFPEQRALDGIARDGVTHVMVHLERFLPHEVAGIELALRGQSLLQLVASDPHGHRLYRVRRVP
jgi:hypothetical protein